MGENTKIEWAHHTFNPWIGCTKVSPACDNCYAETLMDKRLGVVTWGGDRKRTSPQNWRAPVKWDVAAYAAGERRRVFCASLADVFDNQVPPAWRADLWDVIVGTTHLDWLLLTKRPQNMLKMMPRDFVEAPWSNVWIGTTVENQVEADRRIPQLLAVPASIRFLSCEPLLGPVRLRAKVDWVICGGESGPHARPMQPEWARSLRDQCTAAAVPYFFKQWGEWHPDGVGTLTKTGKKIAGRYLDGRTWDEVPR